MTADAFREVSATGNDEQDSRQHWTVLNIK